MKFVLYGNFNVDYTSESHHAKSLEALGCGVIKLQEDRVSTDDVLNESLKSDGLIWVHTHSWVNLGRPMSEVLAILRQKGIPSITYHLDLFMGIPERWGHYRHHDYFNVQYFFTPDRNFAQWINANRSNIGYYLPAGVYHKECVEVESAPQYDVIFVGSKRYHRGWPYRPLLIDWLQKTYGDRFAHFGNDGLRVVRGLELNKLYQSTKVVVGDSFSPNFNYPYFWSDRVPETTGRGGFLVHPDIVGLRDNWTEQELITYEYQNFGQLKEKIDYYLSNTDERELIRSGGFQRTIGEHTYKHRWARILELIK